MLRKLKKAHGLGSESELREEYDFSRGQRGKYARLYLQDAKVVMLAPDVAKNFSKSQKRPVTK
jgi:hypothetical protein